MSHRRSYNNPFVSDQFDPGSPLSGDDSRPVSVPSPKKSKRGVKKRVVSIPIGDVEGSKSKGEAYPPSDSWAWRKYGQKPIKGSPYPRGYYRCSSSKGCPARKQVERSHVDPSTLVITYACDHNHSAPATKHHNPPSAVVVAVASSPSPTSNSSSPSTTTAKFPPDDDLTAAFSEDGFERFGHLTSSEFGWLADVTSTSLLHSPICAEDDVVLASIPSRNDDYEESFFADLGELPECSMVFRQPDARGGRCSITCLGGTG